MKLLLLIVIMVFVGCDEPKKDSPEQSFSISPTPENANQSFAGPDSISGKNIRVMYIRSDKYNLSRQQEEIQHQISDFVNSGKFNVVKINTYRESGRITSAEIYYTQ